MRRLPPTIITTCPEHQSAQEIPMRAISRYFLLVLIIPGAARAAAVPTADLVLLHGKLVTLEAAQPEAQALAVKDGRILAVGSEADLKPYIGAGTKLLDLKGATAVPGFIEGHGHFMGLGQALMELDLTKTHAWDDILGMVAAAVKQAKPGQWIVGRGWHQEKWSHAPEPNVEGLPLHASLDAVAPANPVLLVHASGHAQFVNAVALKLAGITPATPDPAGGEIVRDAKGEPIGMLRDNAMNPVQKAYGIYLGKRTPAEVDADFRRKVRLAAADAVSKGITSFADQGES